MIKKNFQLILVITFVFYSCSKSDDAGQTPETPTINEDFIGLKVYGEKTNSYDESIDLFETSNGYISFENSNKYDVNIRETYEGTANILIRKLDDEFEMIDEFIIETDNYDILSSVAKINENNYVLAGRFSVEKDIFSYPFIKIVNDEGVVSKSLILSGSTTTPTSTYRGTKVFYKDGVIFVADRLDYNFISLVALDMNLNELWRKDFSGTSAGDIYVDDYLYFAVIEGNNHNEPYIITFQVLDITDGSSVNTVKLNNSIRRVHFDKIKEHNGNLYLLGGTAVESQNFGGYILKIAKSGQELDEIFVTNMYRLYDIAFSGNDLLVVGNSKSNEYVVKIDNEGDNLWSYKVKTNTFGGQLSTIINNENGIIFSGGLRLNNETDRSTDAVYGILDDSGSLK